MKLKATGKPVSDTAVRRVFGGSFVDNWHGSNTVGEANLIETDKGWILTETGVAHFGKRFRGAAFARTFPKVLVATVKGGAVADHRGDSVAFIERLDAPKVHGPAGKGPYANLTQISIPGRAWTVAAMVAVGLATVIDDSAKPATKRNAPAKRKVAKKVASKASTPKE